MSGTKPNPKPQLENKTKIDRIVRQLKAVPMSAQRPTEQLTAKLVADGDRRAFFVKGGQDIVACLEVVGDDVRVGFLARTADGGIRTWSHRLLNAVPGWLAEALE